MDAKTMEIGIQISSVRKYLQTPGDVLDSFRKVSKIGYRNIQIQWISPDVPIEFINEALKETNLKCIGTQEAYGEVISELDRFIETNLLWGGRYICAGGMGMTDFETEDGCLKVAENLNKASARLKNTGMKMLFHMCFPNITKIGDKTSLDILLENTEKEVQMELDVYHLTRAGLDPAQWIYKVAGRMDLIHFKDYYINADGKAVYTPVGQGIRDWKNIFEACGRTGVKYCFAEQEDWERDAFLCLAESYEYIKSNTAGCF